jgi:hypothetical protein
LISNEFLAEPGHRFADPVRNGFGREPQCLILVVCGAAPGHQPCRHVSELKEVKQGIANPASIRLRDPPA